MFKTRARVRIMMNVTSILGSLAFSLIPGSPGLLDQWQKHSLQDDGIGRLRTFG